MTDEFDVVNGPEPTDEEIDSVEISEPEIQDLNAVLSFFQSVLITHEAAINQLAAVVFGDPNAQVPDEGATDSADEDTGNDGEVIPVDFSKSDTSDAS